MEGHNMGKIDYKKELKELYNPGKDPSMIKVPEMNYLMIDGKGYPGTSKEYSESIEALYAVAYTLKFMIKKEKGIDYGVPPLEGLWWADDMDVFRKGNKDQWRWTSMIMQPEHVTRELYEKALDAARKKKSLSALQKMRFEKYAEGESAQVMHIGPYSEEGPAIERLHSYIKETGRSMMGKHHEIYLSDPRKAAPDKMKTVIRQPII
jgi:hypothetical protein